MKSALDISKKKLKELEDMVLDTRGVLNKVMDFQMSLEVQFQNAVKSNSIETLAINSASKIDFIPVDQIIYCKANLAYTEVISFNNTVIATKSINEIEEQINNRSFFRISKGILINTKQVHSFNKKTNQVLMKNHELLDVARRRKIEFINVILNK